MQTEEKDREDQEERFVEMTIPDKEIIHLPGQASERCLATPRPAL
jgi:hypothetical protein